MRWENQAAANSARSRRFARMIGASARIAGGIARPARTSPSAGWKRQRIATSERYQAQRAGTAGGDEEEQESLRQTALEEKPTPAF